MITITQTYTKTDIRKVFECFQADLQMLAYRTHAMPIDKVDDYAHDILIMTHGECLGEVHIQLLSRTGSLIKSHEYCVEENVSWDSHRPGANRWPCLPDGELRVIVKYSDPEKAGELIQSKRLKINWVPSPASTNYSHMKKDNGKIYASNGYGLRRNSFTT